MVWGSVNMPLGWNTRIVSEELRWGSFIRGRPLLKGRAQDQIEAQRQPDGSLPSSSRQEPFVHFPTLLRVRDLVSTCGYLSSTSCLRPPPPPPANHRPARHLSGCRAISGQDCCRRNRRAHNTSTSYRIEPRLPPVPKSTLSTRTHRTAHPQSHRNPIPTQPPSPTPPRRHDRPRPHQPRPQTPHPHHPPRDRRALALREPDQTVPPPPQGASPPPPPLTPPT